jgi:hypothetical protein
MELRLKKIYCYGEKKSNMYMAIEVRYGWNGSMIGDIIKLNYKGMSEQAYLTVKAQNPGVGLIVERLITYLKDLPSRRIERGTVPELIIDTLSSKLGMIYDSRTVEEALQQYHHSRRENTA